jgi:hypothetical protein
VLGRAVPYAVRPPTAVRPRAQIQESWVTVPGAARPGLGPPRRSRPSRNRRRCRHAWIDRPLDPNGVLVNPAVWLAPSARATFSGTYQPEHAASGLWAAGAGGTGAGITIAIPPR